LDDLPVPARAVVRNSYSTGKRKGEPERLAQHQSPVAGRLRQVVGADHLLGIRRDRVLARRAGLRRRRDVATALLLLLPPMARHAAFAAGLARFLRRPLVRGALLVRRLAALARDLALLVPVHRCKATILFSHATLLALPFVPNTRAATDVPRKSRKPRPYNELGKDLPYCPARPSSLWVNSVRSTASRPQSAV